MYTKTYFCSSCSSTAAFLNFFMVRRTTSQRATVAGYFSPRFDTTVRNVTYAFLSLAAMICNSSHRIAPWQCPEHSAQAASLGDIRRCKIPENIWATSFGSWAQVQITPQIPMVPGRMFCNSLKVGMQFSSNFEMSLGSFIQTGICSSSTAFKHCHLVSKSFLSIERTKFYILFLNKVDTILKLSSRNAFVLCYLKPHGSLLYAFPLWEKIVDLDTGMGILIEKMVPGKNIDLLLSTMHSHLTWAPSAVILFLKMEVWITDPPFHD